MNTWFHVSGTSYRNFKIDKSLSYRFLDQTRARGYVLIVEMCSVCCVLHRCMDVFRSAVHSISLLAAANRFSSIRASLSNHVIRLDLVIARVEFDFRQIGFFFQHVRRFFSEQKRLLLQGKKIRRSGEQLADILSANKLPAEKFARGRNAKSHIASYTICQLKFAWNFFQFSF